MAIIIAVICVVFIGYAFYLLVKDRKSSEKSKSDSIYVTPTPTGPAYVETDVQVEEPKVLISDEDLTSNTQEPVVAEPVKETPVEVTPTSEQVETAPIKEEKPKKEKTLPIVKVQKAEEKPKQKTKQKEDVKPVKKAKNK